MVDEGIAREVINKIQKLRKKGGLRPTDSVLLVWEGRGGVEAIQRLSDVINMHQEDIETTTKGPIRSRSDGNLGNVLVEDEQKVLLA